MQYHAIPCNTMQYHATLDIHFLSHYSYIKAKMLFKDNHWTPCAGFMDASLVKLGITNDGDILWHTLAYSDILCHTLAYSCILWHNMAYYCILWHTMAYSCILWHTLAYSGILWHTLAYSGILWNTCLLYTSPSPRDKRQSRMPSSA